MDIQVAEVKQRYENLQLLIVERLEDLELMLQFMERCGGVFGLLEWANTTESNIKRIRPTGREVEPLEREIEEFEVRYWLMVVGGGVALGKTREWAK